MKVRELMSHEVRGCTPDDTLASAARIMWEADLGCLPVVDATNRPIAMLTDRDVCMAAYTTGLALSEIPVWKAMSRTVVTCTPDDSLSQIEQQMQSSQVRRLPVVDDWGVLMGMVSLADIARDSQSISSRATGKAIDEPPALDRYDEQIGIQRL